MIRDVSKQYAAFFTEAEEENKKYAEACEEACKEAEELKQKEINDIDEEEIGLEECGFSEADVQVDEVVDPLKMWQDAKAQQKAPALVKVDNNYINMMKKLLSGIKTSKKAVYDRICGVGGKLEQYKKNGTELPPPEDFAENFISFDEIAKIMARAKDGKDDIDPTDGDANPDGSSGDATGDEDMSLASQASKETKDTDNPFGNDMAAANLYDSDLTEAEEEDAKKKAKESLSKAKGEIKDVDAKVAKDFLDKNGSKIKDAVSKIKDENVRDGVKKLVKAVEKYADGKLDESMISEDVPKKGSKDKGKSHLGQFIKATLRMLTWLLMIVPAGLLASAWVAKGVGNATSGLLKKMDKKLAESLALEVCDDDEAACNEDAEELDETGCAAKKEKMQKADENEGNKEKVDEADYREAASHLLDPVGVKASTASLAAQDTAAISVVEKLLSKIEKLEAKIEILESRAEKNSADAATSKSANEADESFEDLDAEEDDEEIKVSKSDVDSSKMKFKSGLDKLSKEETEKVFDELADRIEASLERQKEAGADPSGTKHSPKEVADAVKKINWFRSLSYEKELTDAQKKEFADLVYKFWYDWITVEEPGENDGEKVNVPVKAVKDMLTQPFKSFFGRPGNHVTLATEFRIHDNGNTYVLQPFQYTRDPYDELKTTKARREKQNAQQMQAAADAGKGFKPEKGKKGAYVTDKGSDSIRHAEGNEKGTWHINDWNHMIGTLSKARRKEIEDELRAEIEKEAGDDQFKKAKELAFVKLLFNRAGKAGDANSDYFTKIEKERRKQERQLNAMKKDLESQLEEISKKIESLDKRKAELEKKLKENPDDDDADSELVDVKYDLEEAWSEYTDKEDEIRDMAENADDYLSNYAGDSDDEDDEDSKEDAKKQSDGKVKAQDKRKFAELATVDIAPTFPDKTGKPTDVHAYRSYEKHTIDMVLQTLADVTGINDEKKLLNALSEMPDSKFYQFLRELKAKSQSRAKNGFGKKADDKPKKAVKHRPAAL